MSSVTLMGSYGRGVIHNFRTLNETQQKQAEMGNYNCNVTFVGATWVYSRTSSAVPISGRGDRSRLHF